MPVVRGINQALSESLVMTFYITGIEELLLSIIQRKFGVYNKTRKFRSQGRVIKINGIHYNLSGAMKSFSILIVMEVFYRVLN